MKKYFISSLITKLEEVSTPFIKAGGLSYVHLRRWIKYSSYNANKDISLAINKDATILTSSLNLKFKFHSFIQ